MKELHVKRKSRPLSLPPGRSRGAENSRRRFHRRSSWRLGAPRHPLGYPARRVPRAGRPSPRKRRLGAARCASVNPRLVWRYALRHGNVRSALANRRRFVHRDYASRNLEKRARTSRQATGHVPHTRPRSVHRRSARDDDRTILLGETRKIVVYCFRTVRLPREGGRGRQPAEARRPIDLWLGDNM